LLTRLWNFYISHPVCFDSITPRRKSTAPKNHRDEKDTLGVGQAQLWNVKAVPRQPVLAVAAYSAMLLASVAAFGAERGAAAA
jgi:ABC-type uncharacterized transport system permease subunit